MFRTLLKSKIHRARVTEANLHYEGSVTIASDLMDAADILPYEKVQIVDVDNGARLETYVIPGAAGSGIVCINGAAAHLINQGDIVIIMSFGIFDEPESANFHPVIVKVDEDNSILSIKDRADADDEC